MNRAGEPIDFGRQVRGGKDGEAGGLGFNGGKAEAFGVAGEDEKVRRGHDFSDIAAGAPEGDVIFEA